MRSLPLKLAPGSDLRRTLLEVGKDEQCSGFVLGVVGNLSKASFQCPGRSEPTVLEGNLEIITLNGTFSPTGVHLHLSLSDGECQVWGGHLENETIVLKGAEILVGLLSDSESLVKDPSALHESIKPRVELVVLPRCPWSARALRLIKSLKIPYSLLTIDNDSSFNKLKSRTNLTTFPQVFIDGELIGGYDSLIELHSKGSLEKLK